MIDRFDTYYGSIACKSTGRHIHPDGEFVLASDCAKLEAELKDARDGMARLKMGHDAIAKERDECKRRCERLVLALSEHGYTPEAVAHIAEGRDNG